MTIHRNQDANKTTVSCETCTRIIQYRGILTEEEVKKRLPKNCWKEVDGIHQCKKCQ